MEDLTALKQHPSVFNMYRDRLRLKKDGKEWVASCPLHAGDHTPSLHVFEHQGTLIWNCFGCPPESGNKGSIIDLVAKMDKISIPQAIKKVQEYVGDSYQEKNRKVDQAFPSYGGDEVKEKKVYSLDDYKKYEAAFAQNKFVQEWLLQERGITYETARQLHFGYRQDIGKIAGDNNPVADKGWLMHPVIENDKVVAIEYRSLVQKDFRKQPGMKTDYIFNCDEIDPLEPVLVTEGKYDAAILKQAGFIAVSIPNASLTITPDMQDRLNQAESVYLCGDSDVAGTKAMERYRKALPGKVYVVKWPEGCKDANETFLKHCNRDQAKFKELVTSLAETAKAKPMPGVYSIQHSLMTCEHGKLVNDPTRLRFPWKSVDEMAIILPGTVTTVYSTDSGMGKSTWVFQATIYQAREHKEIVLNYQAEMSPHQIDTIFTSHLLKKDRLQIEEEDYRQAAKILGSDFKYYIGRDTSLTTIGQVLDLIEAAAKRFGATVVVLDNLHFLCRNAQDQVKEQANAMQRITNMAASLGLKFIVVHQARKADQNHKRKVTHISDMDGSKAVQNDSSVAFSIHREEIKHGKDASTDDEHEYSPITEIRLQKVREKGEGKSFTRLFFSGKICAFSEMTISDPSPEPEQEDTEGLF